VRDAYAVGRKGRAVTTFLQSSLDRLALTEALDDIAQVATRAVVGVDSAAVVVHRGSEVVHACSGPLAAAVDTVEYGIGQGPCLHAFRTGRAVLLDLGEGDSRWPTFQAAAEAIGAHTVLSLPLLVADVTLGSLNLYSRGPGAFEPCVIRQAELFAQVSALRLSSVAVADGAAPAPGA
jgi:GAF domain-containing protein